MLYLNNMTESNRCYSYR